MKSLSYPLSLALLATSAVACSDADAESTTLVDVAAEAGNFETLIGALEATGLDEALAGDDLLTVMAPTDDAFARLPAGVVDSLDSETLSQILTYHVIAGEAMASDVVGLDSAASLEGSDIAIRVDDSGVLLNGVTRVTSTDIMADNGIIHVIDSVMLPPSMQFPGTLVDAASAYPSFEPLVGAVVEAELATALAGDNSGDGYTLFAPNDQAFANLSVDVDGLSTEELADVLLYHVIGSEVDSSTASGLSSATTLQGGDIDISATSGGLTLNESATVIRADLGTSNGVIHVIDNVLLPE